MDNTATFPEATDLTQHYPGRRVGHEAARRRAEMGPGADRTWRLGADGEERTAHLLESLTGRTRRDRLLHRPPSWRVLHSVPLDDGRADIDHVLIGPPGVCVINTRHHRGRRVVLDGDTLVVDGFRTDAVARARAEGAVARELLLPRLDAETGPVPVRPVIAVVGAAMQVRRWPDDVIVATEGALVAAMRGLTPVLDARRVERVHDVARRPGSWVG
ncbi:nuclease-related domain-containing protein [Pseudonocardia sp. KRD291]|uniref:nuclease-related domain-containing protein n=1 Tax=Pseudonocardia sp. KRD291 TaxID=2792007 RepID=UPI001C4A3283|nr:nuclease-related domain-containing protein [Pseudonocardia sp. KRD291]MBW0106532.1 NERD domain-containing protein [Pseudonocardia sp. KRD291]